MLIEPIINNHIADSGAGYGRLGNLAFLLKEKKKSDHNGRKHLTETKVLPRQSVIRGPKSRGQFREMKPAFGTTLLWECVPT